MEQLPLFRSPTWRPQWLVCDCGVIFWDAPPRGAFRFWTCFNGKKRAH